MATVPYDGRPVLLTDGRKLTLAYWRVWVMRPNPGPTWLGGWWHDFPREQFSPHAKVGWEIVDCPQGAVGCEVDFEPIEWAPVLEPD